MRVRLDIAGLEAIPGENRRERGSAEPLSSGSLRAGPSWGREGVSVSRRQPRAKPALPIEKFAEGGRGGGLVVAFFFLGGGDGHGPPRLSVEMNPLRQDGR